MARATAEDVHILLVEDDELVQDFRIELLCGAGLRVAVASSATEALQRSDIAESPTVLVTDVHLGVGMDGIELAAVARSRWPLLRTILMSGDTEFDERALAPRDTFLSKPFRGADLLRAIRTAPGSPASPTR